MHADDRECATTCDALNGLFVSEQHCICRKRISVQLHAVWHVVQPNLALVVPFDIQDNSKVSFHRVLSFRESRRAKMRMLWVHVDRTKQNEISPSVSVCAPLAASSSSVSSRTAVWQTSFVPSLPWRAAQHCWWSAPLWDFSDSCLWLRSSRRSDYDSIASNYAMECWVDDGDPYYCHFHWWSCDADDDWGDAGWPSMQHCRASSIHSSVQANRCPRACCCLRSLTILSWLTRSTWECAESRWAASLRASAMSSRCHLMDSKLTDSYHGMVRLHRVHAISMHVTISCDSHAPRNRVIGVMDTSSGHNELLNSRLKR